MMVGFETPYIRTAQQRYGVTHEVINRASDSISRVDNYDEFCYSNKSAIVSKSAPNIPVANISSAELCSIATDIMTLSNELQNAIAAVSVVQTSTSKTAKVLEFGFWQKKNQFI
jgi:hypothetical protein